MSISDVDAFIAEVLGEGAAVPQQRSVSRDWEERISQIRQSLTLFESTLCISVVAAGREVYIQARREPEGMAMEAVSNEFLSPSAVIHPGAVRRLLELGWEPPSFLDSPNFSRFCPRPVDASAVAEIIARTFAEVYDAQPDDHWSVSPSDLASVFGNARSEPPLGAELLHALRALGSSGEKIAHLVSRGELGYPTGAGLDLARRLAAAGVEIDRAMIFEPQSEQPPLMFRIAGEGLRITDDGAFARVRCPVGPFADVAPVLEALAVIPVEGDHLRTVERDRSSVVVTIEDRVDPDDPGGALRLAEVVAARYRAALGAAERAFDRGGAMPDLVSWFASGGLGVPRVPRDLAALLRRRDGCWVTTDMGPSALDDYLMDDELWAYLTSPVPDHVAVSTREHGLGNLMVTWRMAHGPLALCVQASVSDRSLGDAAEDVAQQAGLFRRARMLVDAVTEADAALSLEPRLRRLAVWCSPLRGIGLVQEWDGSRLVWRDMLTAKPGDVADTAWWSAVADRVASASMPQ